MPEKLSFGDMEGEDLATTVLTCEGDITDPAFPFKLQLLVTKLQNLISDEEKPIKVTKVEPWNSVRVTFNIPLEAAQRLRQLAERGDQVLRELGILSVQIEGDQVITLTLAGQFNEPQEIVLRKTTEDHNEVASLTFNLPSSEPVPGPSSAEPAHKNISQFLGHIVGGAAATASTAACSSTRVELPDFPVKSEPSVAFRSPNVIAPSSSEPIPFPPVSSHSTVPSSALLHSPASTAVKSQPTFGPFPFASMNHAMNTKHSSSNPQYQAVHKSSTSPRLPLTTTTATILTTPTTAVVRSSAFTNPNIALSITRPQNTPSPTLQKPSRPVSSPVFNNIASRVAPPNSVVPVSVSLSSPLLVNLLQSETSTLQGHNKLMPPPAIAANQAAKRKRKPRKPKEKATEDGNISSAVFSSLPSPPPSHIGLRSPVGLDAIGNLGQPFNMPMGNIPLSPPTSQISSLHPVTKAQVSGSAMQAQTANIHPQAQGQPPVSLHSVQGQPPLSSSRLIQGPSAISAMRRHSLVHHTPVPNIHPQAQGQPQVHTGNLPLHTHIPVGSPQLARPSNSLPSYAMSIARGVTMNTSRMLFANRDSGLITKPMEKSNRDISLIKPPYKPSASSMPCNSTPESNPFPSPPSSSDGKTKHLINPFTGQLESASDDEEEDESIGSLPPFPDFEVDNSENGQSERSLSDGGKENNLSSDTDSGISKSHTDISQSSSEGASADSFRDQKKQPEIVTRAETVSSASVTSSVPGEKLKLRLKIDPKTIRESKEVEIREKKLKEGNSATVIQKLDAGSTCVSGVKKNSAATGSTTAAPEPRVPPLHISLRGPNSAVVVSPRKEDAKTKHSLGKDRSPRSARTSDTCSSGVSGATRLFDSDKRVKNSGVRDCKKGKDDYWNQNVKNMSGGGIVEVTEKLNLSHSSNYETYLPHVTVPAGAMQRKPSLSVRDSCKSDVITLTSCATGESVSIHTAASSRSPLPFHLMVTPENENAVNPQPSQVGNSSVQVVTPLPERTSKNIVTSSRNHVQEPSDSFSAHCDRKKETLSVLGSRKSSPFMQKGHLPQSSNMQTDSRNSVQKTSRSSNPHPQISSANCVPITSTVPPVSSHSVCVVSAKQCFTKSVTSVVTSAAAPCISSVSDANTPFLKHKNVSKSLADGISPLTSDKCQVSNQCNTNSSSARLDISESAVSSSTVQNENTISNSYSDALYMKDKVLIKEVQMNTTVNRDPTANNYDISTNDVKCSSDGKITTENSVDSSVSVKPSFVKKDTEHKDSIFNNIIDRCKSPLASIMSVTKREIIQDVMNTSEKGLRLIEIKKPPIAQIITVDSIPIQSRVIEVPSLPSSLSVPNSMVRSDLSIEVSSIPSLIPSHGGIFLPPRNTLILQECRSTSLINDSHHGSSEFSRPKVSNSCLDNYPSSRLISSELENERPGFSDGSTEPKIKAEEDSNEQGSSTNPSEESSMDSIDEERKRCMLVSEVRTSTPGPPNDVKGEESETSNCRASLSRGENKKAISKNSHSASAMLDVKSVSHQNDDPSQKQTSSSSSQDVSLAIVSKNSLGVDISSSTENQLSTPALPVLIPATEKSSKNASACDDVTLQNNKLSRILEATAPNKSVNKPETTSVVDPVPTQVLSVQSLPSERTATTSIHARKFEDSAIVSNIVTETSYSTPSSQPLRCNPVCEPISVVCSTSNSVVSSLLSQGRFLPSEVGSGGRVKLIFKGSNPHSVISGCNSPTSVVLPLNASKTVPIKLVTLPGGSAGLSVRSTSNPNVVEIIGQKPPSAHVSSASGSRQLSSPVRLVVSKVSPSVSCSNQGGTSSMRNRVVVKSVVVTGTASPIKLVSATTTSTCSMPTVTLASSPSVLSLSERRVASLSLSSSVPPMLQSNKKTSERSETELDIASDLFNKNSKINSKENPSESNDSIRCHSPFQPVSSHPDITMISSSPEVSISSLSSSSSLCSVPSTNADDSTPVKLKSSDETSDSKHLPTLNNTSLNDSKTETNFLENILNENFPPTDKETNTKNELKSCDLSDEILDCASVGNTASLSPKEEISGAKEIIENSLKTENVSPSPNLSIISDVSSVEHCTNSPDLTIDDTCLMARDITVGSEVQISCEESEQCTDDTKVSVEIVPKCNTDNYDDLVVDQTFLLNAVQNDLCISPNSVIKSEDILEEEDIPDKVKVHKHHIRPFKEPKMEIKANRSGVNTCDGEQDELLKGAEKCQLAATLVYSKPVKRKCSENAAELIKACMGVEDGPKRGLIVKLKDEITEKVEPVEKIEEDGGRMNLRVRRDDATKKCKDCSSDEELALSELISKVRTRERSTRVRPCSRDTPTELVNCRPGRRRSGSNESQKSDEIKSRTRDCKRESKKEETVKKLPERTKRAVLKAQGVQRNVHIKGNDLKQSVINIKDETNAKRKTRSTGNTETAVEVVPGKRRRYSKDGHR